MRDMRKSQTEIDLFVFAGQSNMMGAAVLAPRINEFTDRALEYKYMPRLRGEAVGAFVKARHPAGEWHYNDLTAAYGERRCDLSYRSALADYSANTHFVPALRNGRVAFADQSEANADVAASLAPYFVTEYASYGHSCIYAHMAKGGVWLPHYYTEEMADQYNQRIAAYNAAHGTSYAAVPASAAGDAFDAKYRSMLADHAALNAGQRIANKCLMWLQGESDAACSVVEYKLRMEVLWEHMQGLGFTHFFVYRVGYWGTAAILRVMRAQEEFCAERRNCYIVTRAPSLIAHPGQTTENWWITEPSEEYLNGRDCDLSDVANTHFNENAFRLFAKRSAENVHRVLHLGLEPILEEENVKGMVDATS